MAVKKKKNKRYYVDSDVLEQNWSQWLETGDEDAWDKMLSDIYKICYGVTIKFRPRDEDEHFELTHATFVITITKIKNGRLRFEPGKSPVFNLLTTTIYRQLCSMKNSDSRRKNLLSRYTRRIIEEKYPEARCLLIR